MFYNLEVFYFVLSVLVELLVSVISHESMLSLSSLCISHQKEHRKVARLAPVLLLVMCEDLSLAGF